ncbi:hypothetical protein KEJ15_06575 [Candidatus Bathyarchaeota archaeon]|nr:hypothetical protein [Candidatus Bathyarchaeota archaeon]
MEMKKKNLLLATILLLSVAVTVSTVLAWDVNHVLWGAYGPAGTQCMAGAAGNVQSGNFYQWAHWSGFTQPCPSLGAWSEVADYTNGATDAYTYAKCKYNDGGQIITDSTSTIHIHPDGSYHA